MEKREDRRARTWRKAAQRLKLHERVNGSPAAAGMFAKRAPLACRHCSKKTPGRPKMGRGLCCRFGVRAAVLERRLWRHENRGHRAPTEHSRCAKWLKTAPNGA